MVLSAYRHVTQGDQSTRQGLWEKKKFMGRELTGKTVGIIGLGNIGQLVVKRLTGFECNMLGFDPVISSTKAEELGIELCSLEKLFQESDIVTLHIPESEETRGMVDKKYLTLMKPGAMLINCARAGILNEDDLREIKKSKKLIFCNDVYLKDEPGEKSVADIADILLPHIGASTEEANLTAARRAAEQLVAFVDRGVGTHVVNRAVPVGLDEDHQLLAFYLSKVARCYLGCDSQPDRIEVSLYGGLREYSNWLVAPIVSGISSEFDPMFDFQDASEYLKEKGIAFENRQIDEGKRYGKSMTIDLFEGSGNTITKVSVRGTITEGNPMVSRIDGFDKLYFDPSGKSVLVVYEDKPGMLAKISSVIAKYNININDIRCPCDPVTGDSIAILKVNEIVHQKILDEILQESGARKSVFLNIK
jgi:D-3-phosphoglycerate dehydrogenase / 2-oxoglutarate reductase